MMSVRRRSEDRGRNAAEQGTGDASKRKDKLNVLSRPTTSEETLNEFAKMSDDLTCLELVVAHPNATTSIVDTAVKRALLSDDQLRKMYVLHEAVRSGRASGKVSSEMISAAQSAMEREKSGIARRMARGIADSLESPEQHFSDQGTGQP